MRRMALTTVLSTFVVTIAAATSLTAQAAQLFVGPPGSNSPPGGTAIGGESNLLSGNASGTGFSVGVAGNHTMQSPLLVGFALEPGSTVSLSGPGCPASGCPLATIGIYGLATNLTTLSAGQSLYTQLGLTPGGGISDSYTNLSAADALNGFPVPASYIVEVFAVPASLTGNQGISLSETGAVAGSFVGLYSCETTATPPGAACSGGDVGFTPFTNAGLITTSSPPGPPPPPPPPPPPVPEPSSLAIFGGALLGLFFGVRNRKRTP